MLKVNSYQSRPCLKAKQKKTKQMKIVNGNSTCYVQNKRSFPHQRSLPPKYANHHHTSPWPAVNVWDVSISQTRLEYKLLFPGSSHSSTSFEVQMCSQRVQSDNNHLHIYKDSCKISYQLLLLYIVLFKVSCGHKRFTALFPSGVLIYLKMWFQCKCGPHHTIIPLHKLFSAGVA